MEGLNSGGQTISYSEMVNVTVNGRRVNTLRVKHIFKHACILSYQSKEQSGVISAEKNARKNTGILI